MTSTTSKPQKKKGPIRTEFILVFAFLVALIAIYFIFFFALHLKWIAQKTLSKVYGAEVNIGSININYLPPAMAFKNIQFTNHQKPTHNLFEIGNLSFELNTNDLMFASLTTEEALMTGVRVNTPRKHPGYVSPESQKLVSMSLDLKKNKKAVLDRKTSGNILENILAFSKTKDINAELEKLGQDLKIEELENKYKEKIKTQSELLKNYESLTDSSFTSDIESKYKELESQIKNKVYVADIVANGKSLLEDIKKKKEHINDLSQQLKSQLKEAQNIKTEFKSDIELKKRELKNKFKIPDISPDALAQDFFAETVTTRFYLFKYWLDQIRKNSESKVQNISQKVLSEEKAEFVKDKIKATIESTQKEKAIKKEITEFKATHTEIVHFGSHIRPKFWVKKVLIKGDAKENQDLQNFKGEILNIADDQKIIGKPISITFEGDLPKDNIFNMKLAAQLNHHVKDINETFKVAADYPISSFKIIDDSSLKLYLNKASTRTNIDGQLLENSIKNLKISNELNQVALLFNSSKSDIEKILKPIFDNIGAFNLDIFLKGALDNPDISIISSLTNKISEGLKNQISGQLNQLNTAFDTKIAEKTEELQKKIFANLDSQEAKINTQAQGLTKQLDKHKKLVDDLLKDQGTEGLKKLTDKLGDKLIKGLKK